MDDAELRIIADSLEASVGDDAESQLTQGKPFLWLTANRSGCIHFAISALRAATAPVPDGECRADPLLLEHKQINDAKSDYILGGIQRINEFPENQEAIAERKRKACRNDRVALLGCGFVGFVILFLVMIGVLALFGVFGGGG